MSAVFITATGTEVGKTYVAAGLIRHFRNTGRAVDALKPVVSGFDPAAAQTSDPDVLLAALGRPVTPAEIERISPWRYAAPVAPDLAARLENRALDFDALIEFSQRACAATPGMLLIEGVGGVMTPLDDKHTVLDWITALQVPLLVVTGTYLGSISHTLTCLDVLLRRDFLVKAVVVNDTPGSAVTMHSTTESISRFARSIPIVGLRRAPAPASGRDVFAQIAARLSAPSS
jgi:dethiobiotin synthetase